MITPDAYRRCTLAGQQRTEIFICAFKNHHLISELPASKYTSITTTSLIKTERKTDAIEEYRQTKPKTGYGNNKSYTIFITKCTPVILHAFWYGIEIRAVI